jgi:hypothetical protein
MRKLLVKSVLKKYSIVLTETANTMEKRRVVMKPKLN